MSVLREALIKSGIHQHTCHLQQSVSQGAFSMVNMSNDAKIPNPVGRELREVDSFL